MEEESLIFCVAHGGRKKVVPVSGENYTAILANLKSKISRKFSIEEDQFSLQIKVRRFNCFADIDEEDSDDLLLLREGGDVLVRPTMETTSSDASAVVSPPCSNSNSNSEPELQSATHSPRMSTSSSNKDSFDVRQVVHCHPKGATIEKEYGKNNTVTTETRILLTTIVCSHMVQQFSYYPTREQKIMVAKSIIEAFPNLASENPQCPYDIWFDPNDASKGYINTQFNTLRRSLPKMEQRRPRKDKSAVPSKESAPQRGSFVQVDEIPEAEEEELVLLCKRTSSHNRQEIILAMGKTFQNRRNWIQDKLPCVSEIFKRYPRFRDIQALFDQEFQTLFGEDTSSKLISTWETRFVPGILHVARMSKLPKIVSLLDDLNDPSSVADLDTMEDLDFEPSSATKSLFAFLVMIHLLPSQSTKRSSIADSMDFFLVTKPVGTNVPAYVVERSIRGQAKQPYLLCLGTTVAPSQLFVIGDKEALPCENDITMAVDKLFKLHYVLNLHYASELQSFYLFMEHYVYGIGLKGTKIPVRVRELMTSIKAISK